MDKKATRTAVVDLDNRAVEWICRVTDEQLRHQGRIRELVLRVIADDDWQDEANGVWRTRVICGPRPRREPTRQDVADALRESPTDPLLIEHVVKRYVLETTPRKTGPQTPARSTADDLAIINYYQQALVATADAYEADGTPATRNVKGRAKAATATAFDVSVRTVEALVAPLRLRK